METKKLNMVMTVLKYGLVIVGVIACLLVITGPNAEAELGVREDFMNGGRLGLAINYTKPAEPVRPGTGLPRDGSV